MRVIIPVAGVGTRLRPHTLTTPKPLLPVADKPVLEHILELVTPLNPEEIIFVIGHLGHKIKEWAQEHCSVPVRFVEEETLHGLGYAVKLALDEIPSGPVLILLGDTLVDADLSHFVASGPYVIGLKEVDDPRRFGVATVADNRVIDLVEKPTAPASNLAAIGLYYLEETASLARHLSDLLEADLRTNGEIQLTDGLGRLMREGTQFKPYHIDDWHDCGKVETMLKTNATYLTRLEPRKWPDDLDIKPPVWIDRSARVSRSKIGPNVSIHAGCLIEGSAIENCIIGDGTKIINSTIKDSLIERNSIIKDNLVESSSDSTTQMEE